MSRVIRKQHFIPGEICNYMAECAKYGVCTAKHNAYFRDMTLYPVGMPTVESVEYMDYITEKMRQETVKQFDIKETLIRDTLVIGRWETGRNLDPPHRDNQPYPVNEDIATTWRNYTALTYLNDDYTGGELFFPEIDLEFQPKRGECVIFPAEMLHGVRTVTSGTRYTVLTWLTFDMAYKDNVEYTLQEAYQSFT